MPRMRETLSCCVCACHTSSFCGHWVELGLEQPPSVLVERERRMVPRLTLLPNSRRSIESILRTSRRPASARLILISPCDPHPPASDRVAKATGLLHTPKAESDVAC